MNIEEAAFQEAPFHPGHLACAGCAERIGHKLALLALGPKTILVIPACCSTVIDGIFPHTASKIPLMHTAFETTAAAASGVKAALLAEGKTDITVLGWAGDGGTFDIGFQALSAAAERNEDFIYVCYDNEAYMNTGIQRSSATPFGAWTTTTPLGQTKDLPKKNIVEILAAHRIPYAATVCPAYPQDLTNKFRKAKKISGFRFIHLFSPCPTGWKFGSDLSIKLGRLAVESKVFPLYEVEKGEKYHINYRPKGIPVGEYLLDQGRFKHLKPEEIAVIQENVDKAWHELLLKEKYSQEKEI
ncbi:MAG: 2-ketoisovalerate ferredoxin oxidoreductase [candidate division Zixibacteria bacterium RBG_16_50_21]|nr:MAG: 2-ketoisovalerate ferredoxin oxidoreductase [candidate division Zixibacteria bacterium RBG_16_50_21]